MSKAILITDMPESCNMCDFIKMIKAKLQENAELARPVGWSTKQEIIKLDTVFSILDEAKEELFDPFNFALVCARKGSYEKAIEDMTNNLIRNSRTEVIDGKICLIVTDKRIKQIAEQLKEGAGE